MDQENQTVFPYIYGSMAFSMGKKSQSYTHKWICYVRGYYGEDLSYLIQKVQFVLHSSFQNPVRTILKPPFEIQQHGWGQFQILIRLHFKHPSMPTIEVSHMLKLHHNHNTGSQAAKKPLCSEVYDEVVFTQNDEHIQKISEEKEVMKGSSMVPEVENGQELQVAVPELPLRSINYYSRYFSIINQEEHKIKLDDALRFITGELKSLQQKMRNADMDLNKVYDQIYDRIP